MKDVLELAQKVCVEATEMTGWKFEMSQRKDRTMVRAAVLKEPLADIHICFEFENNASKVGVFAYMVGCPFKKSRLEKVQKSYKSTKITGSPGDILMAHCDVPYEKVKNELETVVRITAIPMYKAVTKIAAE